MSTVTFTVLGAAVLLGAALFVLHLRPGANGAPWPLAVTHGLLGLAGLGCLILLLRAPPPGPDRGTAAFGVISAALIATAAVVGVGIATIHLLNKGRASPLIGIHATLAVSGFVILAAYLLA